MKPRILSSFGRIWQLIIQVAGVRNKHKRLNRARYAIEAIAKDGRMIFKGVKSLQAQTTQETILLAVRDAVIAAKILGYKQLIFLTDSKNIV